MEKVTIYYQGVVGFNKVEAKSAEVQYSTFDGKVWGVKFVKKGCRKPQTLLTYYSPVIKIVKGWGRPNPPSAWKPAVASEGCVVQEAKFTGCSPEWRAEFEAALQFAPEDVLVSVV